MSVRAAGFGEVAAPTDQHVRPGRASRGLLRRAAVGWLAGALAGVVAIGIGSRAAMRVVAIAAGDGTAFTPGGTGFLLATGLVLGAGTGLVYVALAPRLPDGAWRRPLAFGGIGTVLFVVPLVITVVGNPGEDPDIPTGGVGLWVGLGLFAVIPSVYALLAERVATALDRRLPAAGTAVGRRRALLAVGWLALLPVGAGGLLLLGTALVGSVLEVVDTVAR